MQELLYKVKDNDQIYQSHPFCSKKKKKLMSAWFQTYCFLLDMEPRKTSSQAVEVKVNPKKE